MPVAFSIAFNSTMVRLERGTNSKPTRRPSSFNSTMVRLEPVADMRSVQDASSFNSTMVRLEHNRSPVPYRQALFQFHDGTIGTHVEQVGKFPVKFFQFHDGTIGTFQRITCKLLLILSIPRWYDWNVQIMMIWITLKFLSIPRWYDWNAGQEIENTAENHFQFHDGTIGTKLFERYGFQPITFQFHDGTIGTNRSAKRPKNLLTFNSTMVRLEPAGRGSARTSMTLSIPRWYDWNGRFIPLALTGESTFNSTMVRLEQKRSSMSLSLYMLSIPRWYDWNWTRP